MDITINGTAVKIFAHIDPGYPQLDKLVIDIGVTWISLWSIDERKAFIAALIEADAELDAAIEARTAKTEVAA